MTVVELNRFSGFLLANWRTVVMFYSGSCPWYNTKMLMRVFFFARALVFVWLFFCFNLFERREREEKERGLLYADLLLKCPEQLGLGQLKARSQEELNPGLHMVGRDPRR